MRRLLLCVPLLITVPGYAGPLTTWRAGVANYSQTGHVPNTPLWNALANRYALNPARFDANHPRLEGLFSPPATIGMLPTGAYWDNLRHRYTIDAPRFDANHPGLAPLLALDNWAQHVQPPPPQVPPPITGGGQGSVTPPGSGGGEGGQGGGNGHGGGPCHPPGTVPEPPSLGLGLIGVIVSILAMRLRSLMA